MAKNKLVLRVNMCFSNLHSKIFFKLPIEDQKKWIFDFDVDDQTFSEPGFIEKVSGTHVFVMVIFQKIMPSWDMGMFLDAMRYMKVRL